MAWHERDVGQVMEDMGTSSRGLSAAEVSRRLGVHGPNALVEKKRKTPLVMLADQFKDFMILVLIAAALVSGFIGELTDTVAIVVIVVLNAVIGFVQEYRADRAMEALKKMAAHEATVVRDGRAVQVPAEDLVPGDWVVFEAGNVIPADMRLAEAVQLSLEEAALTG
ncbi:MAG TPA: cation-transporting P-type ATPase, partial [Syntrophales bacterium]|nr:cation-transporting P-type ATPase [Syntrophales bacterium]